jgi:hypothetical protein
MIVQHHQDRGGARLLDIPDYQEILKAGWGCVEWTRLAQDRGRWQAVVNAVMNFCLLATQS